MANVLRYPYEALTDETDYLQINLVSRGGNNVSLVSTGNQDFFSKDGKTSLINKGVGNPINGTNPPKGLQGRQLSKSSVTTEGIILLPMPSSIVDTNQVNYSDDTLDGVTAELASLAGKLMTTDITKNGKFDLTDAIAAAGAAIGGSAGGLAASGAKSLILAKLAADAAGLAGIGNLSLNQALARTSGQILNPNMELLFNGPTIRNFRFSFKMTPRDENEANQIRQIIRSLKIHMSPQDGQSDLFLRSPNIFELRYKKGQGNNEYLHRFKRCALENMSVNYTGENVYATYSDGAPVSTVMNLSFKELEPIYASDYTTPEGQIGVGY